MYLEVFLGSIKYICAHVKPIKKKKLSINHVLKSSTSTFLVDYTVKVSLGTEGRRHV